MKLLRIVFLLSLPFAAPSGAITWKHRWARREQSPNPPGAATLRVPNQRSPSIKLGPNDALLRLLRTRAFRSRCGLSRGVPLSRLPDEHARL
jgi:hypothetical protein